MKGGKLGALMLYDVESNNSGSLQFFCSLNTNILSSLGLLSNKMVMLMDLVTHIAFRHLICFLNKEISYMLNLYEDCV